MAEALMDLIKKGAEQSTDDELNKELRKAEVVPAANRDERISQLMELAKLHLQPRELEHDELDEQEWEGEDISPEESQPRSRWAELPDIELYNFPTDEEQAKQLSDVQIGAKLRSIGIEPLSDREGRIEQSLKVGKFLDQFRHPERDHSGAPTEEEFEKMFDDGRQLLGFDYLSKEEQHQIELEMGEITRLSILPYSRH